MNREDRSPAILAAEKRRNQTPSGASCQGSGFRGGVAGEILLLRGNTGDFPELSVMMGDDLRKNRRCHPAGHSPAYWRYWIVKDQVL